MKTSGTEILRVLVEHGPLTTDQLRTLLPHIPAQTVRTTVIRLSGQRHVSRQTVLRNKREITKWSVGPEPYVERKKVNNSGRARIEDTWTPQPWVNPIKAGTASKVQAAPWVAMDYSDPRR